MRHEKARAKSAEERVAASVGVGRRARLSARTKFDLVFDTLLVLGFAIAYAEDVTGLNLHEWFGIAFGVALLVHLSLHWDWVVRTARHMLTTSGRRRFLWLMNFLLSVDLILCVGSGIEISGFRVFGVTFSGDEFWSTLHGTTASVAIGLIGIHIGLDWRWVTNAIRRMSSRPFRRTAGENNED